MTSIRQLFDEAVESPPPSRLSAIEIYRIGQSRWRRRLASLASALVGGGVAAILLATVVLQPAGSDQPDPPVPTVGGSGSPPGPLRWAGMADAKNLYAVTHRCERTPSTVERTPMAPPSNCDELLASTDGGATWSSRGMLPSDSIPFGDVRGRGVLTMALGYGALAANRDPLRSWWTISVDGGANWAKLDSGTTPLSAVPVGATVNFGFRQRDLLSVVDPTSRQVRPLANQPQLTLPDPARPKSAGHIWVTGFDPTSLVPAIAVSHDAGQSWVTRTLPGASAAAAGQETFVRGGNAAMVAEVNATTAYAVWMPHVSTLFGPTATPTPDGFNQTRIYRTTDGGQTWRLSTAVAPRFVTGIWATDDGRLVLEADSVNGAADPPYYVSSDGVSFERARPPGLPDDARTDGRVAYTDRTAYVSEDGWTFRQVWPN